MALGSERQVKQIDNPQVRGYVQVINRQAVVATLDDTNVGDDFTLWLTDEVYPTIFVPHLRNKVLLAFNLSRATAWDEPTARVRMQNYFLEKRESIEEVIVCVGDKLIHKMLRVGVNMAKVILMSKGPEVTTYDSVPKFNLRIEKSLNSPQSISR